MKKIIQKLIKEEVTKIIKEQASTVSEDDWTFNRYRDATAFCETLQALGIQPEAYEHPKREGRFYYVKFYPEHKDNYETAAKVYEGILEYDQWSERIPVRL